ncbi:MAG: VCBS repeat-containing protein [Planctomycetota bacterium]|nr:MAG: VCBS repeat-containing protein [Planctomycetota bacterium]
MVHRIRWEGWVTWHAGRGYEQLQKRLLTVVLILIAAGVAGYFLWKKPQTAPLDLTPEAETGPPLHPFYTQPIGVSFDQPPRISHVQVVDLDLDGRLDVLVCDARNDRISWLRQSGPGQTDPVAPGNSPGVEEGDTGFRPPVAVPAFEEVVLATDTIAPAHAEVVDLDSDGDLDILVAVLGKLYPTNDKIGSLIVLENDGTCHFQPRVLQSQVARVSDVRAGELDGVADLDLVVTHFGYDDGLVEWLENRRNWDYQAHPLLELPGGIHGIPRDFDADGDLDIAVLISQQHETIYMFEGDGAGRFVQHVVLSVGNPDFGSSGMWEGDLDGDGDLDLVYCNGDAFDYSPPKPWPWHGVQWLENQGGLRFQYHRLTDFGGAVGATIVDFDNDGDQDIFACSTFNEWTDPRSQSLILLENRGQNAFLVHDVANSPTHIQTLDAADINGDGKPDLVSGGMHVSEPYDRMERVLLWLQK